jgi:hypothetical protein
MAQQDDLEDRVAPRLEIRGQHPSNHGLVLREQRHRRLGFWRDVALQVEAIGRLGRDQADPVRGSDIRGIEPSQDGGLVDQLHAVCLRVSGSADGAASAMTVPITS